MKIKIFMFFVALHTATILMAQTATAPVGSGTEGDPYQISSLDNLYWLSKTDSVWGSWFIQTTNIEASESENWDSENSFSPIGVSSNKFTGNYNGKGYEISHLYINLSNEYYVGLFGYTNNAELDSMKLVDCNISGERIIGGLVGYMQSGSISNSFFNGSVSGTYYIGGMVGYISSGSINKCYSTGNISGDQYTGGLIGMTMSSSINNSYSSCIVSGVIYTGGFIGQNSHGSNISNCYATGNVFGSNSQGGFAGINIFSSSIQNCYSMGRVFGDEPTGGAIGINRSTLTNCYFNTKTSGQSEGIGDDNQNQTVTALDTDQMKSETSFSGFDFTSVWSINDGNSFPGLKQVYDLPILLDDLITSVEVNETYTDTLHIVPMENKINSITLIDFPTGMELISDSIIVWIPNTVGIYNFTLKIVDINGIDITSINKIVVIPFQGNGTETNPYQITDIDGLNLIHELLDNHFILMNDLDFTGTDFDSTNSSQGWLPIGSEILKFTGSFNGNGHSISNLYINRPEKDYVGLFGYTNNATINNLALINGSVTGGHNVGGLAGYVKETDISICYSSCSVSGEWIAGGLIGYIFTGNASNCYVTGNVSGSQRIGGLAGYNQNGTINNCYAAGRISSKREAGGLVGYNNDDISNSYYNTETSGQSSGIGKETGIPNIVTGLTTSQMKNAASFSGFDFGTTWTINEENSFPRLHALYNAPVVLHDISQYVKINEVFTDTLHAIDMDYEVVSFSLTESPDGMVLVNNSIIRWTPESTGTFYFSIKATDNQGMFTSARFKIVVLSLKGDGTEELPYQITTVDELDQMRYFPGKHYVLINDLDFSGTNFDSANSTQGWKPVGSYANPFNGVFNGSGHTISNMYINRPKEDYIGLLGWVEGGVIQNLGVSNGYIKAGYSVGGMVGQLNTSSVSNCFFTGFVSGKESVGGIVGEMSEGVINNCYSTADIYGEEYVGGLLGALYEGNVSNCYAVGTATGTSYIGGLTGYNNDTIQKCYATGKVFGDEYVGALAGYNTLGITDSYFNLETTGQIIGIGVDDNSQTVTGLTIVQMKQDSSFTGFDFDSVWAIRTDSTYPALRNVNNAPFAFADTSIGSFYVLLGNDYDYETIQNNLTLRLESIVIKQTGEPYITGSSTLSTGDTLLVSYHVGELHGDFTDTLWGNSTTSVLLYENHAPVITSAAPISATTGNEYIYNVKATDEDGDALRYSLSNAPEGMVIHNDGIVSWIPANGIITSGVVTLIVSDLDLTDTETFTITVNSTSGIDEQTSESIILYPNPVNEAFKIAGFRGTAKLCIYNALGELMLTKEVLSDTSISIDNFNPGTYVIKIETSYQNIIKSLVKVD